jgi:hypothetical protein
MRLTSTRLVKPSVTQRLRKSMKRKPGGKGKRRMGRPGQGTQIEFLIKVSDDVFESRGASAPNIQPGWLSWSNRLTSKIRGVPFLEIE